VTSECEGAEFKSELENFVSHTIFQGKEMKDSSTNKMSL